MIARGMSNHEQKHPHGRGEDAATEARRVGRRETPPRAWGRLCKSRQTSQVKGKHPHGRGEDGKSGQDRDGPTETPPRAWGRLACLSRFLLFFRNTPTGVGKTHEKRVHHTRDGKHPHGRGEDITNGALSATQIETPPRAWGRLSRLPEKEQAFVKHPHGRGEDPFLSMINVGYPETPPRAWGRLTLHRGDD